MKYNLQELLKKAVDSKNPDEKLKGLSINDGNIEIDIIEENGRYYVESESGKKYQLFSNQKL